MFCFKKQKPRQLKIQFYMKMWISDVLNKLEALPNVACICPEKSPLKLYNAEAFG